MIGVKFVITIDFALRWCCVATIAMRFSFAMAVCCGAAMIPCQQQVSATSGRGLPNPVVVPSTPHFQLTPGTPDASPPPDGPTAGVVYGDVFNGPRSSSGGVQGSASSGYAQATAAGDGTWVSGGGGFYAAEGYTVSVTSTLDVVCQGSANVEGWGAARLVGAVGTAFAGGFAESEVRYASETVLARAEAGVAIAAGMPGTIGINTQVLGLTLAYTLATGNYQGIILGIGRIGLPRPAKVATVQYNRQTDYGFNINLGTAEASMDVGTHADVMFTLVEGG